MYCGRPRELTITETQSHPRGANAKGCGLGILTFATQLSVVPTDSCALAGFPNARECDQRETVVCFELQRTPKAGTCPLPACHLVCRSYPEAWLSFVYPTGASAAKFARHLGLSRCRRQHRLNLTELDKADGPARGRGHEHSAHVSQWGGSGDRNGEGSLNDNKSILLGTEASMVRVRQG